MATNLLASLFGFGGKAPSNPPNFPYDIETNPYQCKRPWPPDFSQLSTRHQFQLERRFRRRSKLKWARPRWTKAVKLTQWGAILFVVTYGVFYLDVHDVGMAGGRNRDGEQMRTVFDGIREWYEKQMGGFRGTRDRSDTGNKQGKEDG